jgi:RNA polymerase sigma-70 factor (ECF subfamily)
VEIQASDRKELLAGGGSERGKFRSFLLTAVKHFLANTWDRANALKRGGGSVTISMDLAEAEDWHASAAVEQATPETLFQRRWALSLLEGVMAKLRIEFANEGKAAEFDRFSMLLNRDSESAGYDAVAKELGVSAGALRMSVHRLRRRYRRLLRAQIAETVCAQEEIDEELRYLLSVLSN